MERVQQNNNITSKQYIRQLIFEHLHTERKTTPFSSKNFCLHHQRPGLQLILYTCLRQFWNGLKMLYIFCDR